MLSKVSIEAQVFEKIKEIYSNQVKKLSYCAYAHLIALLHKIDKNYVSCTGAEYFLIMEKGNPKYCDKLIKTWFETVMD